MLPIKVYKCEAMKSGNERRKPLPRAMLPPETKFQNQIFCIFPLPNDLGGCGGNWGLKGGGGIMDATGCQ